MKIPCLVGFFQQAGPWKKSLKQFCDEGVFAPSTENYKNTKQYK